MNELNLELKKVQKSMDVWYFRLRFFVVGTQMNVVIGLVNLVFIPFFPVSMTVIILATITVAGSFYCGRQFKKYVHEFDIIFYSIIKKEFERLNEMMKNRGEYEYRQRKS